MKSLNEQIKFQIEVFEKVEQSSQLIIKEFENKNLESALSQIENRDRLMNILFKVHKEVDEAVKNINSHNFIEKDLADGWLKSVQNWSEKLTVSNQIIQGLLESEKAQTTNEIATVFDQKSRHKGYDLNNVK